MLLGVIADIHSNAVALEACLQALRDCDGLLLLGDYVSDTPWPAETMDRLYRLAEEKPCRFLRGNREDYMLTHAAGEGPDWPANSASGNLLFTYERLRKKDLEFFASLPICFRVAEPGCEEIIACHGSPGSDRELLQPWGENTRQWLERVDAPLLLSAHTHHPAVLKHMGKTCVNPGSCGIAIDDPGHAQCAVLESAGGAWQATLLSVPYDLQRVVETIFTSGLYDMAPWFMNNNLHTLVRGIDKTPELVRLATALGGGEWPNIP